MSTFKNAKKSFQKTHKERGQLKSRKHLGLLEKHKDYVLRARDYHAKQKQLKILREKAANKNPDEFYFKMINSKTVDGEHRIKSKGNKYSASALKLMKTQDLNYIHMKKKMESQKIEKLQANLHLLEDHEEDEQNNQHIIFVDSKKEAKSFDAAKHFNTLPELVSRTYNRPTLDTLKSQPVISQRNKQSLKKLQKERSKQYRELKQRIQRKKQLNKAAERLQLQKHLMGKGQRRKINDGPNNQVPVYKWRKQRKK